MRRVVVVFYLLSIAFLLLSFYISFPFRIIGFLFLLIASIITLIDHLRNGRSKQ